MGISSSSCLTPEIPGHIGCVSFGTESREIERKLQRVPSCRLAVTSVNTHIDQVVVFSKKKKKRGKQLDGSDFCNRLHWIPWYIRKDQVHWEPDAHPPPVVGAGKTSLILKCLPKFPRDYKVVLLKNEFGDVQGETHAARKH